ncbi:ABC transporter ATP-binding protein [Diplocloster agilis]|uniref:ABC transporter ATP-binding protein n=1 Tax=Diplocloster agilis TaxID=2850323 RepID=A0A949K826_9FIRM|nr:MULTISPECIES: ABC transporter ATP-binding protein [Lachnospiraceae]MBU9737707.1 ABC transporter ATP-binding protein [Diplocloster agilis]MBU9743133.1 ABC transporter ATP-binding protein [Diplocloster agilis]MCU6735651.1 ABC transporter ATP-binding protein [Suonthocola fibrivorans]SCJ79023.1 Aliphatic sulfonates import ATP-binding protein SsuB [uncultured Clostridium sp.]
MGQAQASAQTKITQPEAILNVDHLTKKFGDLLVLNDISFDVKKGEFLCIVGPTGCGKTTFLNSLTRLYKADDGKILFEGEEIDPQKHDLAYIFQEYSTMEWLNVEENIRFGLKVKGYPKELQNERVEKVIKMVGLDAYRKYYPRQLSASMLQRVVIARGFAVEPKLLLMDEPYGQLDLQLKYKLEDELLNLWQETGTTVIFITHNIEEAVYLSDRILVLTNKPTKVKKEMINNLPRPRKISSDDFINLRNEVTELIKWW